MKTLYANGCSWTAGADLENPSKTAWPIQLANILEYDVINDGLGGGSNQRILRRTTQFVNNWIVNNDPGDLLVVIMWTSVYRIEVPYLENGTLEYKPLQLSNRYHIGYWREFCDNWIENHLIDADQIYKFALEVSQLWFYLTYNNIPFMFMDSFSKLSYLNALDIFPTINIDAKNKCDISFLDFISKNKLKLGKTQHPLEDSHAAWANNIHDHLCRHRML